MFDPESSTQDFNESDVDDSPLPHVRNIKDPIYDYIEVDPFFCQFIDNRQFQRLRNIKQLGTSYFVWPGGCHNRFEHCLGVMHLAKTMVEHLAQQPGLNITLRDRQCVQLAGLLHDLGHGPFSHVFDGQFIPRACPGSTWKHEDASELMLEAMIRENDIDIPRRDIDFVRDLIAGIDRHPENEEKPYLFQIVANKQNGIDVDKFDYIARDTHQIGGAKCSLAAIRLIKSSRVIGAHIAYSNKDITNVFLVFQERWSLHKRVYTHPAAKAIEYMVVDALLAADSVLQISDQITDPDRYVFLTDSVIEEIERSSQPELAASREIIGRLRKRRLYKCVDVIHLHAHEEEHWKRIVTCESIVREANRIRNEDPETRDHPPVLESDVIVDWTFVHFGMRDKNPVDLVFFYGKHNPNVAIHAKPEVYSHTFPHSFAEVALRVFTRNPNFYGLIQAGFRSVQHICLQKLTSNGSTQKSAFQTPRQGVTPLPENVDGSGGTEFRVALYDSNPFTSVPPSFTATGSPSAKSKQLRGRSIASLPSSRASPVPGGDVLPLVAASTGTNQSHATKRSREIEMDTEDISKVLNVSKKPKLK